MFGRAVDASTTSPGQAPLSPDGASANRDASDSWRNGTNLDFATRLDAFWRGRSRAVLDAQSARVQQLAERAAQLEEAAERFRRAGDEQTAASFAEQAAELRRAGA